MEPTDRNHTAQRVEGNASSLSVLAAVPGNTGCRQPAHFLFNFVMPMWDALQQLGWSPERVSLFVDCTGMGPTRRGGFAGVELEDAGVPAAVTRIACTTKSTPVAVAPHDKENRVRKL